MASFAICGHSETQNKPRQAGGLMVRDNRQQLAIEPVIEAVEGKNVYDSKVGGRERCPVGTFSVVAIREEIRRLDLCGDMMKPM